MYKCKLKQHFVNNFQKMTIVRNVFWLNTILMYGGTCKTKISSKVCISYPRGAYASAEQSAVSYIYMYVDPNRLVFTLTKTRLIFMINVFCCLVKTVSSKNGGESSGNYRNPELKQLRSGVWTVLPAFRMDTLYLFKCHLSAYLPKRSSAVRYELDICPVGCDCTGVLTDHVNMRKQTLIVFIVHS